MTINELLLLLNLVVNYIMILKSQITILHDSFHTVSVVIGILLWYNGVNQHWPQLVLGWVTVLVHMYISVDSPSDENLNRGPLALLLRQQYEFPFGIYSAIFDF